MFKRLSRRENFSKQQNILLIGEQPSSPKLSLNNNNNKFFEGNAPQLSSKQFYEYMGTFSKVIKIHFFFIILNFSLLLMIMELEVLVVQQL